MYIFIIIYSCYGKASEEADIKETGQSPVMGWKSEGWKLGEEPYQNYIFSREDRDVTLQITGENFGAFGIQNNFLLQVMEEDGDNGTEVKSYDAEAFFRNEDFENLYESTLQFSAEEGEEKSYKVRLEYTDSSGNEIVSGDETVLSAYGTLEQGIFQSKTMVIDKSPPMMEESIELEQLRKTEGKEKGSKDSEENTVTYFNSEIQGTIEVEENYLDDREVRILAVPLNDRAGQYVKESNDADGEGNILISDWNCDKNEGNNRITFTFSGEGKWKIEFRCADTAQNLGIVPEISSKNEAGKNYIESEIFIIDTEPPEVKIQYEEIEKIAEKEASMLYVNQDIKDDLGQITSSANEIFLRKDHCMKIQIAEDNFCPEDVDLELCSLMYDQGGGTFAENSRENLSQKNNWERDGENQWTYLIKNLPEGHYRIRLRYKDCAGNQMTARKGGETMSCIQEDEYIGPVCTADWTKPVITACEYEQEAISLNNEKSYFNAAPVIVIKVAEENFNGDDFTIKDVMTYADGSRVEGTESGLSGTETEQINESGTNGERTGGGLYWKCYYEKGVRINETRVTTRYQANHTAECQPEDSAGNVGDIVKKQFTYDSEPPEITYTGKDNESGDIIFKMKTGSKDEKKLMIFRPYRTFRYFGNKRIKILVTAHDKVSGVEKIVCSFTQQDSSSKKTSERQSNKKIKQRQSSDIKEGEDLSEYRVNVLADKADFKGYFCVRAEDFCKNLSDEVVTHGVISETKTYHETVSGGKLGLPEAVFTDEEEKIKYYNSEIEVKASFYDNYSGLLKTELYGTDGKEKIKASETMEPEEMQEGDIVYEKDQSISLSPEKFKDSSKSLPITVYGEFTDNAGNDSGKISPGYKIVLDNIKPEINVQYDCNKEGNTCYNLVRTASITIKDKNFNPDSVKWEIQGSNREYRIGEWEYKDDTATCKIYFGNDGENYAVGVSAADYAGNRSVWKDRESFTIDLTAPRISIEMSEEGQKNDKYYNSAREIYFRIEETNFDKAKVKYEIKALDGDKDIKVQAPEEYVVKGNVACSRLVLKKNGQYKIGIRCTDMAGNFSEKKELEEFVIDTKAPELEILGIEKNRTYTDKVVPEVLCTDKNLNLSTVKIILLKGNGKKTDRDAYPYEKETGDGKAHIVWSDFAAKKKMDGIYRMYIAGEDMAGNKVETDKNLCFSVNRFGADFEIDEETIKKISPKYLKEETDVFIKERSVNFTKSKIIVLKDNETRTQLEKGRSYTVSEKIITDKDSLYFGWYEKTYKIKKENFSEEGSYKLLVQSDAYETPDTEFGLIKRTDNEIKGQPVYFIIDKTPPVVSLGNLESIKYKEKEHYFTITALDNFKFDEMELEITNGNGREPQKVELTSEDLGENNSVTEKLTENSRWQTIRYIARDKAGNQIDSDKNGQTRKCLITTKEKVHAAYKEQKFYGGIAAVGIGTSVLAGAVGLYIYKRKKFKSETERTDGTDR